MTGKLVLRNFEEQLLNIGALRFIEPKANLKD